MIRLDKLLHDCGYGSRKEVKALIRKQRVTINDIIVKNDDIKVDETKDIVKVDGEVAEYHEFVYIMLNKPAGVVSATFDNHDMTVIDLVSEYAHLNVFPFGRLDKDSEGLLIISNDGKLAHELLSNKKHVSKRYYVEVEGRVDNDDVKEFEKGITIDGDEKCLPASLDIIESDVISRCFVTIMEGKFHQVKRMFEARGKLVTYLKRVNFGNIPLDESLEKGKYRLLSEEEINLLKNK